MSTKDFDLLMDYLKELIRCPSVVGNEMPFFRLVKRELQELGIKATQRFGILIAEGESPESGYLSAHVDRHGLLCTGHREFQYAAFIAQNKSEQTGNSTSEEMFWKIAHRFAGQSVNAYEPWSGTYLGTGTIRDALINERMNNLFMVIDGLDHLDAGVPIGYSDRLIHQGGKLSAQLDNVLMVAMILFLYAKGYRGTAFFTAQEEAGRSWRFLAEWFVSKNQECNRLLVLDTSPFNTTKEAFAQDLILRRKDATAPFDLPITNQVEEVCKVHNVPYLFKDAFLDQVNEQRLTNGEKELSLGRTELGRLIEATGGKVTGTTLQIPTINYHTANETATIKSVKAAITVLMTILDGAF